MVDEHIIIAEMKIGRQLKKDEVVHHLDNNKHNNHPCNLIVFIDNSSHIAFHHGGSLISTSEDYVFGATRKEKRYCKSCGVLIDRRNKTSLCKKCLSFTQRKCERPSKEDLLLLINKHSFLYLGRMFGVSNNTIRKWCKKYGII